MIAHALDSDIRSLLAPDGAFYVFAYGSLIWRPGFDHAARHPALLRGFHRRFCLWSHRYRGTPERPGLVLGLDRGGACRGVVFRVPGHAAKDTLAYLDARELPDGGEVVYRRRLLPLTLLDTGRRVPAITYVANRECRLYCGKQPPALLAQAIKAGHGQMGSNRDYFFNTLDHLGEMGVRDRGLEAIAALLSRQ
jgi:cation transport protein ChaC